MSENGNGHQFITRDFRFASARRIIEVDCRPDLECSIRLRALGYGEAKQLNNDILSQLAVMIVGEDGERLFTTDDDLKNLAEMPMTLVLRLLEAAASLNGISKTAVEETKKNFLASQSADSVSA